LTENVEQLTLTDNQNWKAGQDNFGQEGRPVRTIQYWILLPNDNLIYCNFPLHYILRIYIVITPTHNVRF